MKTCGTRSTRTSFWAQKIEFMIGIYDADKSGDTEIIRIRGVAVLDAGILAADEGLTSRLISSLPC